MTAGTNQDCANLAFDGVYDDESSLKYLESQLCIPDDRLEDINFFPNFDDDLIRLSEELLPELQSLASLDDDDIGCKQESADVESNCFDSNRKVSVDERELSSLESEHSVDDTAIKFSSQCNETGDDNIVEVSFIKNKKPRTNKRRKENRNLMLPLFVPRFKTSTGRRRCIHCQADETPQWRAGPMGRNTLCNACGLRYKSGRLVPEYRPASSPSFDNTKHSNYYKRILQKKLCEEDDLGKVVDG